MKKRRLLKSIVAIIALTAMLMENTYSVMASIATDDVIGSDDAVIMADDAPEAVITEGEGAEDTVLSDGNGTDTLIEPVSPDREIDININDEEPDALISENASVEASDDGIEVSAADEVTLYVNTDQMNASDTFRLDIKGSSSLDYSIVLDGRMSKSDSDIYTIKGLAGKRLTVKAAELSSGLKAEYKVRSDGNPQISLVSADEPEAVKKLSITSDGLKIKGSGYNDITLSLDASALSDNNRYNIYVDTKAKAQHNGDPIEDGVISSLSRSTSGVRLSNLDNKAFTIYIEGRNTKKIKASYTVESIDNGAVAVVLSPSDEDVTVGEDEETGEESEEEEEEEATKRVYTYEDDGVSVTATLQYADAIPDDAEFAVTKVTSDTPGYNYDAYIEALNNNAEKILGEEGASINGSDVLLYDVAFFGKDENGNRVELQPEEGSVAVSIRFKNDQIEDELGAEEASEVKTVHLPLIESVKEDVNSTAEATAISASDIKVEVVRNSAEEDKESVNFTLSDFSIIGITNGGKLKPGPDETFKTILGSACVHGVVANYLNATGHFETNFAAGTLNGGANVATCKNDEGNAGVTYVGEYVGSGFFMDPNGNKSVAMLYTTTEALSRMHESMRTGREGVVVDTKYSKEQIQKRVSDLVSKVAAKSTELSKVDSYAFSSVANNGVLDIAGKGSGKGTYYITFNKGEYAQKAGGLKINLADGQKVVLTIPDEEVIFQQITVNGHAAGGTPDEDAICQSVVLNCPNATYAKTGGSVAAVVLVPNAEFDNGTVSAGWLVADEIMSFNSEWHCVWHDMPPADGTSDIIKAKKTVEWKTPNKNQIFKFGLYEYDKNTKEYKLLEEVQNNGEEITFAPIYFNEEGTYKYKVIEHEQSDDFAHDPTVYYIEYKVELDKNLNQYVIKSKNVTKAENANGSATKCEENTGISFNNQKKPKVEFDFNITKLFYTEDGTDWSKKKLTEQQIKDFQNLGGFGGNWPDGATFTFNIERFDGGSTNSGIRTDGPLPDKKQVTVTKDNRTASFGKVFFEADIDPNHYGFWEISQDKVYTHTYMYKITEVIPADEDKIPGVFYTERPVYIKLFVHSWFDWKEYSAKISVEGRASYVNDNSIAGQECFSTAGVDLEFINAYYPGSLTVKKVVVDAEGKPVDSDKDFYITVYRKTSSGSKVYYGLDGKEYLNVHTEKVKGNNEITFAPLPTGNTYYVYETDEYGVEVAKDGTVYQVSYSGLDKNNGVEIKTKNRDKTVSVTNKRKNGTIRLIKWDKNKTKKLAGAKFVLYKDNQAYNGGKEYEIGSTGTLEIGDLPWGTYYFKETKAPEGYVLPAGDKAKTKSVIIDSTTVKEVQVIDMVDDEIYGDLIVYKVDDNSKALAGAEFALFASKGNDETATRLTTSGSNGVYKYDKAGSVQTLVTDSNGVLKVTGIPYGDYAIQETKAPADHVLDDTVRTFVVKANGAFVELKFINPKIRANVEFIKVDPTDAPVEGIYFNLFKEIKGKYEVISTVVSGTNGHVRVEGLGEGNYYFQEDPDKNNDDYVADDTMHRFSIAAKDNGQTLTLSGVYKMIDNLAAVVNTPTPGDAELFKYVLKGNKRLPLEGAEFELYMIKNNKETQIGGTYVTNEKGIISVTGLAWGSYYFKETKAPKGFNLNPTEIKFNITRTKRSYSGIGQLSIEDTPITGWVELEKVDKKDTNKKLDGITFALYKGTPEVPGALVGTYKTGVTVGGKITKEDVGELEYGDYYFQEVETIKGYVLNSTPITFQITENGKVIKLIAENDEEPGSVILHKYDNKRLKKLDGALFTLYKVPEGVFQKIGAFFGGNKIEQFETANGGIIEVDNLEWGTYYFEEDKAPEGYIKSDKQYVFTIDADNRREELDYDRAALNDEDTGAIKLIKENQDGEPIEGVKFALYKDNNRYPDEFKFYYTDSKGEIFVDNLPWGSYFFEEAEVPVGYETPADPRTETVVIDSSSTIQTVKYHELRVNNTEITGYLDVIKVDDKLNKLAGAEFSLQRLVGNDWKKVKLDGDAGHYTYNKENGTPIFTQMLKTDGAALTITGLPFGPYRLYEEKAPDGFNKVGSPFEFTIDEQGEHIEYNFINTPVLADVEFIKVDLEDGHPVTGAVFKLCKYDDDSKTSYTQISELRDVKGVFRYEGLGSGDYFVQEISAPNGYKPVSKIYTFSITEADNGNTVLLDNADRTEDGKCYVEEPEEEGKVRLFKADKKTGNALKGAYFDLYTENGKTPIRKDLVSDDYGYVRAEGLAWGKYYFVETVAPDNYALDKNKHWFEVNQDNASAEVEITLDLEGNELRVDNTPIYAGADLIKQDELSHDEIKGAEFALFYDDGTDKNMVPGYESMKTDADGKISTNLDLKSGKYYFKEINPAPGYVLTDKHYNFTIDETVMNQIVHAGENGIAYNPPIPGEVELLKYYNNETGEKIGLPGAKFTLYLVRPLIDKELETYTTDANGIISVSNLNWGTYYFLEKEAPKGFQPLNLSKDDLKFEINASNQNYTMGAKLTAENPPFLGKVKLTKYLVEGTKKTTLEGAKFKFYKVASPTDIEIPNTSDPDGLYTSGSDGTIVIEDLKWGSYYFDEVEAPEGCVIPTPSKTGLLEINASNVEDSIKTPISVDVYNDKVYGNASILKIDDQNHGLKGAEFGLFTADGRDVYVTDKGNGVYYYAETGTENKLVSPEGGLITVKQLPYGDYYFKETKAPATFSISKAKYEFSITRNQTEDEEPQCKLTCVNTPIKAAVEFTKVSSDIEHPLGGCVFELYKDKAADDGSDLFIANVTSDDNGRVYFEDLGPGNYHFKEIKTKNDAYELHKGNLEFVITDADKDTVVGLSNVQGNVVYNPPIPGSIGLEKYYKVGDVRVDKLAGAKFDLYKMDENGNYNIYNTTPYVIPDSGVLIVKNLDWTSYYFEEVEAPKGYSFDPELKYYFTITEADAGDTPLQYIQADNPRNPGKVEIEKVDSTDESKLLSGVTFHLYKNYKAKDQEDLGTKVTKAGKVEWDNLTWGDYTVIEDETIDGYVKNDKEYTFTISESCLGVSFTGGAAIPNPPIQGYFNLEKKDEVSKEPIESVEFELYKVTESGSSLMSEYKLITNSLGKLEDQNGNTKIGPLKKGSYYLKEIVPNGYKAPKEDLSFDITYDGQVKSFSSDYAVYNTPINGEVVLYKVDENKKPLAGAEFTLYATKPRTAGEALAVLINKKNVYVYGVYTTDENGEIHVYDLPWDNYFFMETKAPAGYEIIDKDAEYTFEVNAQKCNDTIPIGPIGNPQLKGELELTKVDSLNKNAIEGAKFKLYMVGEDGTKTDVSATYGATNGVFVTNDKGVINIKNVEWGTYYFDEVESGEGYEPITKEGQVRSRDLVINETNWSDKDKIMLPQKDTVDNVKGKGYVMLIKKFDGHKPDPDKIKGIKFDLHNVKTGEVKEFETDENGVIAASTIGALEYGSYYFTEKSVPAGSSYKINDFELHFTISRSNPISQPIEYEFTNSEILASAQFIKVDPFEYDYEEPNQKGTIDGIKFFVYKVEAGKPDPVFVTEVTSAEGGIVKVEHLPMGDYYFLEDAESAKALGFVPSPDKYTFTIGENDGPDAEGNEKFVDVFKDGEKVPTITVPNPKADGSIRLEKLGKDSSGKVKKISLKDAEFELYEETKGMIMGREELAKLNKGDEIVVDKLPWGRYYFKEVTPPKGYALPEGNAANSNVVEIDQNNVSQSAFTPLTCQITDDTVRVYISKREMLGTDELPGAQMSLYNADSEGKKTGDPILKWTSSTKPKLIEIGEDLKDGLVVGNTYVIHEIAAPNGFVVSFDITFTVNSDGSVATDPAKCRVVGSGNGMTIIVDDGPITVYISKKELGTDIELSGAKLQIRDEDGVIESWSSTGASHQLTKVLEPDRDYILEEVNPPKGYYTAEPITFRISKGGLIQIVHDESASATCLGSSPSFVGASSAPVKTELTMYDRPIKVEISKKRLSGSDKDYVEGAKLTLSEKDGEEYKPIASWESTGKPYLVEYGLLKVGCEYKVTETAAPKGYTKADDVYFKVKDFDEFEKTDSDGTVTQKVTVLDPPIKVVISKKASTGEDELPGAVLQVVDDTGAELAKFQSQNKQTLITSVESADKLSADEKSAYAKYNVIYNVKFEAGKEYTLKELSAPAGYALADPVTFRIDENGNQTPSPVVMKDKPLEIKISKKDIGTGKNLAGAELELYNEADELVAKWTSAEKPVLISIRQIGEAEAADYSEVIAKVLPAGKYRLHEAKAPEGYKLAEDVSLVIDGATVKKDDGTIREESMYDYKDGSTSVVGKKEWIAPKDSEGNINPDYVYPTITIELYRDSAKKGEMDAKPYKSVKLENGATSFAFGNLERYRTDGNENYEYTYKVVEVMSDEASSQYTSRELEMKKEGDQNTVVFMAGFENILNQEYIDLNGTKTFTLLKDRNGKVLTDVKYDDVAIYLLQNGKRVDIDGDGKEDFVEIKGGARDTNGVARFSFKELPRYDLTTGNAYKYTIEEAGSNSYIYNITYTDDEVKINNTPKAEPFRIHGVKTWVDPDNAKRPEVTIQLYRDGKLYRETKLNKDNTFDFTGLYEYNLGYGNEEGDIASTADGHKFFYEVKEAGALGYDVKITGSGEEFEIKNGVATVNIKNTIKQDYVEKSGNKFWNDRGDSSKRPSITVYLLATDSTGRNNEEVDRYVIPNTSTRYEFGSKGQKKLPKYDANGKVIQYTIREQELPGYIQVVNGDDITNTPSKVVISKLDATEHTELPGAVLSIVRKSDGKEVERWTSGSAPHYIEALEIGEVYTLTEISAPSGYAVASPVDFQVGVNGVEQKVEMYDDPIIGSVTLTKIDASTREKLSGAEFNLYSSDGNVLYATGSTGSYTYSKNASGVKNLVVNGSGELKVDKLPYGTYYFKEIKAPKGYELKTEAVNFSITDHGVNVNVTYEDPRISGAVMLKKTDESGNALSGAEFELYSKTPTSTAQAAASTVFSDAYYRYGTYTTDSDGRIEVKDLPWDEYYFIETKAPEGYETNRDIGGEPLVYTFSISADNAGSSAVDLGNISNNKVETGVLGERVPVSEKVSGVLGVRSKPKAGVLGTRVGPATGDASAIALWITLLVACIGTIVWMLASRKKKGEEGA